jgi:hypothetical protein
MSTYLFTYVRKKLTWRSGSQILGENQQPDVIGAMPETHYGCGVLLIMEVCFFKLHLKWELFMFNAEWCPPLDRGMTWSRDGESGCGLLAYLSIGDLQIWQTHLSLS